MSSLFGITSEFEFDKIQIDISQNEHENLTDDIDPAHYTLTANAHETPLYIIIILTVIIVVGVASNVMNIFVFGMRTMRQASTFRFLLYLSIVDLLVLLVCATDALIRFGFDKEIRTVSSFTCSIHTFLTYFLTHCSSVILMVTSVDRALVVTNRTIWSLFSKKSNKNPCRLAKKSSLDNEFNPRLAISPNHVLSSPKSPKKFSDFLTSSNFFERFHRVDFVIISVLCVIAFINAHYIIFLKLHTMEESTSNLMLNNSTLNQTIELFQMCFPRDETIYSLFLIKIWTYVDIVVYALVPFVIMSICSIVILIQIRNKSKKFFKILKQNEQGKSMVYRRARRNRQLLTMLLITNSYFLFTLLPYCISFIMYQGQKSESSIGQLLVHLFLYSNNAINFLFYGISSQRYRNEFGLLFNLKCENKTKNKRFSATDQTVMI
jgi:hypothetical protein